ncbi:MAG: hypothetical protein RL839_08640, partial [Gammaproteobacteria bacterium]
AAPLQKPGHPLADHLEQVVELCDARGWRVAEAVVAQVVLYIHAIQEQERDAQIDKSALLEIEMPNADGFIDRSGIQ